MEMRLWIDGRSAEADELAVLATVNYGHFTAMQAGQASCRAEAIVTQSSSSRPLARERDPTHRGAPGSAVAGVPRHLERIGVR